MDCLKNQLENNCCVPVIENGTLTLCNPFEGCVAGCCTPFFACLSKVVDVAARCCNIRNGTAVEHPKKMLSKGSNTYALVENPRTEDPKAEDLKIEVSEDYGE